MTLICDVLERFVADKKTSMLLLLSRLRSLLVLDQAEEYNHIEGGVKLRKNEYRVDVN